MNHYTSPPQQPCYRSKIDLRRNPAHGACSSGAATVDVARPKKKAGKPIPSVESKRYNRHVDYRVAETGSRRLRLPEPRQYYQFTLRPIPHWTVPQGPDNPTGPLFMRIAGSTARTRASCRPRYAGPTVRTCDPSSDPDAPTTGKPARHQQAGLPVGPTRFLGQVLKRDALWPREHELPSTPPGFDPSAG